MIIRSSMSTMLQCVSGTGATSSNSASSNWSTCIESSFVSETKFSQWSEVLIVVRGSMAILSLQGFCQSYKEIRLAIDLSFC